MQNITAKIQYDLFDDVLPPLDAETENRLIASIREHGVIDPLRYWVSPAGEHHCVDGHNRLRIARACGRLDTVRWLPLVGPTTEQQVRQWMLTHQLTRRNLSPEIASLLRGKLFLSEAQPHGGQVPKEKGMCQVDTSLSSGPTADRIAKETGVSPRTIHRDADFARAVDERKAEDPEIERKIVAGEVRKKDVLKPRVVSVPHPDNVAEQHPDVAAKIEKIREAVNLLRRAAALIESVDDKKFARNWGKLGFLSDATEENPDCETGKWVLSAVRDLATSAWKNAPVETCPICKGDGASCRTRDKKTGIERWPCHESGWLGKDDLERFDPNQFYPLSEINLMIEHGAAEPVRPYRELLAEIRREQTRRGIKSGVVVP